ncbi:MAG: ribonuclease R [Culicoidibacterales bacterium]
MKTAILAYLMQPEMKQATVKEIVLALGVSAQQSAQVQKNLDELEQAGDVIQRKKNSSYQASEKLGFIKGTVIGHARGFAFMRPTGGTVADDYYLKVENVNGAYDGDLVLVKELSKATADLRKEGVVVKIIQRSFKPIVGTIVAYNKSYLECKVDDERFNARVFIAKDDSLGAVPDHKVVVQPLEYYEDGEVLARVSEIIGHKNDPGVDILSIIYKNGISTEFSAETLAQAAAVEEEVAETEYANRKDHRYETIVTIDGDDAKDLDDAVTVRKLENGNYFLGVHIADVSYYVTMGSPMSKEAYERGTSVYLVDRVIPMLPHRLSNGICSLNPHVDRLVMSCEMEINSQGEVVQYEISQGVIHSAARMTYRAVNEIITDQNPQTIADYAELVPMFQDMHQLAQILEAKRYDRGALEFDIPEAKIEVDEAGKPIEIHMRERGTSERIIEQFMLEANECVAKHFKLAKLPFIYRIHEEPSEQKLENFTNLVANLGYPITSGEAKISAKTLQQVLKAAIGTDAEAAISTMLLRSMQKARYSEISEGHYGLAAQYYTHFTSPIRRYPDLVVHRCIREFLINQQTDDKTQTTWKLSLPEIAQQTSTAERRAIDCERAVDDMKKAEYMLEHVGETFSGIVSSVTNFGLFVELPNTIEGLVHMSDLSDDHYEFHQSQMLLIGKRTSKTFKIGDHVEIEVMSVDKDKPAIDFKIVGMKSSGRGFRRNDARPQREGNYRSRNRQEKQTEKGGNSRRRDDRRGSSPKGKRNNRRKS